MKLPKENDCATPLVGSTEVCGRLDMLDRSTLEQPAGAMVFGGFMLISELMVTC